MIIIWLLEHYSWTYLNNNNFILVLKFWLFKITYFWWLKPVSNWKKIKKLGGLKINMVSIPKSLNWWRHTDDGYLLNKNVYFKVVWVVWFEWFCGLSGLSDKLLSRKHIQVVIIKIRSSLLSLVLCIIHNFHFSKKINLSALNRLFKALDDATEQTSMDEGVSN